MLERALQLGLLWMLFSCKLDSESKTNCQTIFLSSPSLSWKGERDVGSFMCSWGVAFAPCDLGPHYFCVFLSSVGIYGWDVCACNAFGARGGIGTQWWHWGHSDVDFDNIDFSWHQVDCAMVIEKKYHWHLCNPQGHCQSRHWAITSWQLSNQWSLLCMTSEHVFPDSECSLGFLCVSKMCVLSWTLGTACFLSIRKHLHKEVLAGQKWFKEAV